MTPIKEELAIRMIRMYGFEHPAVIDFCRLCEDPNITEEVLTTIVINHERH